MFEFRKKKCDKDWIQRTLEKIDALDETMPASDVRYSVAVDFFDLSEWEKQIEYEKKVTFQQLLMKHIQEKNLSNKEFYKAAFIDRKLFSAIKTDINYHPRKETAVACCFALKLNYEESEKLLKKAGYDLSLSIQWDRIVYYCLSHQIYDLDTVNELLYERGEKCIRT